MRLGEGVEKPSRQVSERLPHIRRVLERARVDPGELVLQLGEGAEDDLGEEMFLVPDLLVDGLLGDRGLGGDLVHAGAE